MNIPNLITVGRIFLVPLVVWLIISGNMQLAVITFVIAGLSDALDGYLAKRFNWQTVLGAYLDPVADKALLMSIYVVLGIFGHLPVWLVIAVVSRDVIIIGAILLSWIVGRPVKVHPLYISKANTAGQIFLAALVMADLGFSLGLAGLTGLAVWVTGALTVLSAGAYLVSWLRHMASYEAAPAPAERPVFDETRVTTRGRKEPVHGS